MSSINMIVSAPVQRRKFRQMATAKWMKAKSVVSLLTDPLNIHPALANGWGKKQIYAQQLPGSILPYRTKDFDLWQRYSQPGDTSDLNRSWSNLRPPRSTSVQPEKPDRGDQSSKGALFSEWEVQEPGIQQGLGESWWKGRRAIYAWLNSKYILVVGDRYAHSYFSQTIQKRFVLSFNYLPSCKQQRLSKGIGWANTHKIKPSRLFRLFIHNLHRIEIYS